MSLARKKLREIFDLRLRLEPYAVRRAVPRLTVAQLAQLSDLAQVMLAAGHPGPGQDLTAIVELNRQIVEVAPRDGLQNEAAVLSTEAKLSLIEHLGVQTGATAEAVGPATGLLASALGSPVPGPLTKAGPFPGPPPQGDQIRAR